VSAEGVPVLLDRADVLKALRDALNVTDNRVTQAFGKPWIDDAASRIMAIQPALPASTADARVGAWKAMAALVKAADAINEGFDPFTSMNCVCSDEAQERCASPVAPEDAPCSTCRHRKLKIQADAARAALALAAKSGGGE